MLPLRTLVVAADHSECARRASAHAMHLAHRHGAAVHVLHVVEQRTPATARPVRGPLVGDERTAERLGLPMVDDPEAAVEGGCVRPVQVYARTAAEGVLRYAGAQAADLIVVGRPGRGGLRRRLRVGTTRHIVRGARCPVLTVPAEHPSTPGAGVRRLLVAVDLDDASTPLVAQARVLAATYGAEMDLLHVLPRPIALRPAVADRFRAAVPELVGYVHEALHHLLHAAPRPAVEAQHHVLVGQPGPDIVRFAAARGADLVAVASSATGRRPLGPVVRRVLREAPCLVAVLKHEAAPGDPARLPLARHLDAVRRMYLRP